MPAVLVVIQEVLRVLLASCAGVTYLLVSVPVATSASVAISTIPLLFVVAKSSFCKTKLVPSYTTVYTPFARITPVCGSFPSIVLIFFTHGQKSIVQAPVFEVVGLNLSG